MGKVRFQGEHPPDPFPQSRILNLVPEAEAVTLPSPDALELTVWILVFIVMMT
jgi:hypothetical protein